MPRFGGLRVGPSDADLGSRRLPSAGRHPRTGRHREMAECHREAALLGPLASAACARLHAYGVATTL
jgi:hypothetical protein